MFYHSHCYFEPAETSQALVRLQSFVQKVAKSSYEFFALRSADLSGPTASEASVRPHDNE
jgi:hypothetical protein